MWAGRVSARHVAILAEQLKLNPFSRVRAQFLGDDRWIGWTSDTTALATISDNLVALLAGLAGASPDEDAFLPRPRLAEEHRGAPEPDAFAASIADFNVGGFLRRIYE